MRRLVGWLGALVVGGLVASAPLGAQDFEWTGQVARGQSLTVKGINGIIRAGPAGGDRIVVSARKDSRYDDIESVDIEVVEDRDGVLICAVYPDSRGRNRCARGDDYHMSTHDNDVEVDFDLQVPAGVTLYARNVNGEVEIEDLRGDVHASTVNGDVFVETTGLAEAKTVNGSIDARMGASSWDGNLEFQTVNGGITLELPGATEADVEVSTLNGDLETDFALEVRGRVGFYGPRKIRGQIGGGGGGRLSIETVNGSVRLRETG